MASWRLVSITVLMASGCAGPGLVAEPLRSTDGPGREQPETDGGAVQGAVEVEASDEAVWLRTDRGVLLSYSPPTGAYARHLEDEMVISLYKTVAGQVWALTRDPVTDDLRVWTRDGATWT